MSNLIEQRPWGQFEVMLDTPHLKVKTITVNPGQRLSYQLHHKRSENWFVVSGTGTFTVGEAETRYPPGTTVFIPAETPHRIANYEHDQLVVLEVQTGSYFGEDDIVRLADDYGRLNDGPPKLPPKKRNFL